MTRAGQICLAAFLHFAALSSWTEGARAGEARPKVCVSVPPQAFLVERIAGPRVMASVLLGPGQSEHVFEPTPKQVADMAGASVYFLIGLPFEKGLAATIRSAFPNIRMVDLAEGLPRLKDEGGHENDPHVWMDPKLMVTLAAKVRDALADAFPQYAAEFRVNHEQLVKDLGDLDARIRPLLAPHRGKPFLVFHPAFGYFAESYGLRQVAVEVEGKEPSAKQLAEIIDLAKKENVRVMFVQPQFSKKSAEAVAREVGAKVVTLDALSRDYISNLDFVARSMRDAFASEVAP